MGKHARRCASRVAYMSDGGPFVINIKTNPTAQPVNPNDWMKRPVFDKFNVYEGSDPESYAAFSCFFNPVGLILLKNLLSLDLSQ